MKIKITKKKKKMLFWQVLSVTKEEAVSTNTTGDSDVGCPQKIHYLDMNNMYTDNWNQFT